MIAELVKIDTESIVFSINAVWIVLLILGTFILGIIIGKKI
jgi:hypothetical protein